MQARQGDIFFQSVTSIPTKVKAKSDPILAYGEVTGHSHAIMSPPMSELDSYVSEDGDIYVRSQSGGDITVTHDEHSPIILPGGDNQWYHVFRQREYDPILESRRLVAD